MFIKQPFDVNKTIDTLEPEVSNGGGGLFVPKDRPKYIAPASKKSVLGMFGINMVMSCGIRVSSLTICDYCIFLYI